MAEEEEPAVAEDAEDEVVADAVTGVARIMLARAHQARKARLRLSDQMSLIMGRRLPLIRCELHGRRSQNTLELCVWSRHQQ